MELMELDKS